MVSKVFFYHQHCKNDIFAFIKTCNYYKTVIRRNNSITPRVHQSAHMHYLCHDTFIHKTELAN